MDRLVLYVARSAPGCRSRIGECWHICVYIVIIKIMVLHDERQDRMTSVVMCRPSENTCFAAHFIPTPHRQTGTTLLVLHPHCMSKRSREPDEPDDSGDVVVEPPEKRARIVLSQVESRFIINVVLDIRTYIRKNHLDVWTRIFLAQTCHLLHDEDVDYCVPLAQLKVLHDRNRDVGYAFDIAIQRHPDTIAFIRKELKLILTPVLFEALVEKPSDATLGRLVAVYFTQDSSRVAEPKRVGATLYLTFADEARRFDSDSTWQGRCRWDGDFAYVVNSELTDDVPKVGRRAEIEYIWWRALKLNGGRVDAAFATVFGAAWRRKPHKKAEKVLRHAFGYKVDKVQRFRNHEVVSDDEDD